MRKKQILVVAALLIIIMLGAAISSIPYVQKYFCVGCGDCVKICPTGAITLVDSRAVIDAQSCIDCGQCVKTCNYNAIRGPK